MVIRDSGGLGGALSVRVAECATLEATGDCDFNITVESTFALHATVDNLRVACQL
jgi:hypothetical protein